jgi:hypothetical protein
VATSCRVRDHPTDDAAGLATRIDKANPMVTARRTRFRIIGGQACSLIAPLGPRAAASPHHESDPYTAAGDTSSHATRAAAMPHEDEDGAGGAKARNLLVAICREVGAGRGRTCSTTNAGGSGAGGSSDRDKRRRRPASAEPGAARCRLARACRKPRTGSTTGSQTDGRKEGSGHNPLLSLPDRGAETQSRA